MVGSGSSNAHAETSPSVISAQVSAILSKNFVQRSVGTWCGCTIVENLLSPCGNPSSSLVGNVPCFIPPVNQDSWELQQVESLRQFTWGLNGPVHPFRPGCTDVGTLGSGMRLAGG
ncbi:uncharacterized protein LOC123313974 [Coccinella septempunctata]|uniref:uncharacterized protein LOC123313974 n=1 Tax=Coccinella septempunctata TaxID=41139 RepID=UPI001D08014F|nr:uncharacterized protein LOC123313974 [Coccinella septempunctata]